MLSLKKRIKRYVPRTAVSLRRRINGSLLRGRDPMEGYGREVFFYKAFKALSYNGISGDYLEFGCDGGNTFQYAYHESRRFRMTSKLWAFDSFAGLPPQAGQEDEHPAWIAGAMATKVDEFHELCRSNRIPRSDYEVVPGYYDESLAAFAEDQAPNDIALAYIDCDLYSSTMAVLEFLSPRMKHGMVMAFDDYFCWSGTNIAGERRAMLEFINGGKWNLLPFVQYSWGGMSFIVEDAELLG